MTRSPVPLIKVPLFVWLVSAAFMIEIIAMAALVIGLGIGSAR
jgi:hypothetical protein